MCEEDFVLAGRDKVLLGDAVRSELSAYELRRDALGRLGASTDHLEKDIVVLKRLELVLSSGRPVVVRAADGFAGVRWR